MQVDTSKIRATVYAENAQKKILYIKFEIPDLQMYINSCTVRPSDKYGDLWFQLPKFMVGRAWLGPIEFQRISVFYDLLRDEAMRAAEHYIHERKLEAIYPGAKPVGQDEVVDVSF